MINPVALLEASLLGLSFAERVLAIVEELKSEDPVALEEIGPPLKAARDRLQAILDAKRADDAQ
jgi:hypothetical protein